MWFSNWGAQEVIAVDVEGNSEVVARVETTLPFSIDWLPDGRLLIVSGPGSLSNRRVWAELGEGGDGICMDAEGAVWCPAGKTCMRVREGGGVLEKIELDRSASPACSQARRGRRCS